MHTLTHMTRMISKNETRVYYFEYVIQVKRLHTRILNSMHEKCGSTCNF